MAETRVEHLDVSTRLSVARTILSHERTLMSWVRTALALITFGFTIYKFFAFEAGRELPAAGLQLSPRIFGMIMIGTGLVALGLSAIAHRTSMRHIQADYGVTPRYGAFVLASIVSILGLMAFAAALMRA
jgi:putative membrane protein